MYNKFLLLLLLLHMRMNLQSYEDNQICLALFHGTGKNVQLGPSEH